MLVQLHWQHRLEPTKTIFVAQDEVDDENPPSAVLTRFYTILSERIGECPADYGPMVCDENSDCFVVAPHIIR